MWGRRTAFSLLFVLIAGQVPGRSRQRSQETQEAPSSEARIEISSVTVTPAEIHTRQEPDQAIVTVQLFIQGKLPPGSVAAVAVGTYSGRPPFNDVSYTEPQQTLPLKTSPASFDFEVRPSEKTVNGRVIIAASIVSATRGIEVTNPMTTDPSVWQTELKTVVP